MKKKRQTRYLRRSGMAIPRCNAGNGVVLSAGDNVPTAAVSVGWGLAKPPKGNASELLINPVMLKWRKTLTRHAKRQVARERCSAITAPPPVVRPGKSESLKEALNVGSTAPGKPVGPHRGRDAHYQGGIRRAIEGDGPAGKGGWRKRRLSCNGRDRATSLETGVEIPDAKACPLPTGLN